MSPHPVLALGLLGPLIFVIGLRWAELSQEEPYFPTIQTISALARYGASDRWIMTGTLFIIGLSYVALAAALPAARVVRMVLALGGSAVVMAALFAQPTTGSSVTHMSCATVAWCAFAAWPLLAVVHRRSRGRALIVGATGATCVIVALIGWFVIELVTEGMQAGLAERCLIVAETLWPAVEARTGLLARVKALECEHT